MKSITSSSLQSYTLDDFKEEDSIAFNNVMIGKEDDEEY